MASRSDHDVGRASLGAVANSGDDAYLPLKVLATYCGLSVRTLRDCLGRLERPLPSYRIGGKILVRRSEFDAWAQQFRRQPDAADIGALVDDVVNSFSR